MSIRFAALLLVILALAAVTAEALLDVGFLGILKPHFQSWGGAQVFLDLVILAVLACIWMVRDARAQGVAAWPFVLLTLAAGSFGPLAYLVLREVRAGRRAPLAPAAP